MSARVRHRQVSPERIAKVAAALTKSGVPFAIKLGTDGSATLTPPSGETPLIAQDDAADEWAKLGIQ